MTSYQAQKIITLPLRCWSFMPKGSNARPFVITPYLAFASSDVVCLTQTICLNNHCQYTGYFSSVGTSINTSSRNRIVAMYKLVQVDILHCEVNSIIP